MNHLRVVYNESLKKWPILNHKKCGIERIMSFIVNHKKVFYSEIRQRIVYNEIVLKGFLSELWSNIGIEIE